jgi:hypothetical protein
MAQTGSSGKRIRDLVKPVDASDPAATQPILSRTAAPEDRAIGHIYFGSSHLRVFTNTLGEFGSYGPYFYPWYMPRPNSGSTDRPVYGIAFNLGIGPGPWWPTAQVHEAGGEYQSWGEMDWEAVDGARGTQYSDPPVTYSGVPMVATSNLPDTWPPQGWPAPKPSDYSPAPEWLPGDAWDKWKIVGDVEIYTEFDDNGADRNVWSKTLGITGRKRAIGYAALNAIIFQIELTNNSPYDLTNCWLGSAADLSGPVLGGGSDAYPEWDASRDLLYVVGHDFDPVTGTHHRNNTSQTDAGWFGQLYLQTPGGDWKTTGDPPVLADPSGPANVVNRVALMEFNDSADANDEQLYGAMSGILSYFGEDTEKARQIWKTDQSGTGQPVYIQTGANFTSYDPNYVNSCDPFSYVSWGPFTFNSGDRVDIIMAGVSGLTKQEMEATADLAIQTYQNKMAASGPPKTPQAFVAAGTVTGYHGEEYDRNIHDYPISYTPSGMATITWDGSLSAAVPDAFLKVHDFQGFRVYRSMDRGHSWGESVVDETGKRVGWVPIAQYDLDDGIKGRDPLGYMSLGDDTGLEFSYTDTGLLDGMEYWYAVTAYDYIPADSLGTFDPMPSLESAIGNNPASPSVVGVVPGSRPNGYVPGTVDLTGEDIPMVSGGPNDGSVTYALIDDAMLPSTTYTVTMTDTAIFGNTVYPGRLGVTLTSSAGDTYFTHRLPDDPVFGDNLLPAGPGFSVQVDSRFNAMTRSGRLGGATLPTGLRAASGHSMVYGDSWPDTMFAGDKVTSTVDPDDITDATTKLFPAEIRFSTTTTQNAYVYMRDTDGAGADAGTYVGYVSVPFTAWDMRDSSSPRQVNLAYTVDDTDPDNVFDLSTSSTTADSTHWLSILSSSYSGGTAAGAYTGGNFLSLDHAWMLWPYLQTAGTTVADLDGLTATFDYERPIGPGSTYSFSTTASSYDGATVDMDAIRVVPNPYYVYAPWDQSENLRKIQFQNVPPNTTIDIYTVSGELVASLRHDSAYNSGKVGIVDWNLWTYEYTEAAYGLYIYVAKTADGKTRIGKFAIIR